MAANKSINSPFAWINGKRYLKVNYRWDPDENIPSLLELVAALLMQHDEQDIILLRPLSRQEEEAVAQALDDAEVDVYASLLPRARQRIDS